MLSIKETNECFVTDICFISGYDIWVSVKFDFWPESLKKKKFCLTLFLSTIWLLDALKRTRKLFWKRLLNRQTKKPGFKFNPGLVLISLQTTGPWVVRSTERVIHFAQEPNTLTQLALTPDPTTSPKKLPPPLLQHEPHLNTSTCRYNTTIFS